MNKDYTTFLKSLQDEINTYVEVHHKVLVCFVLNVDVMICELLYLVKDCSYK